MTIKTVETENEGLKRAFMLTIPAKDIEARVEQEVKRIAPQVRMPGFRPGKVPPNLIRKMHGDSLRGDALQGAVQDGVQQLLSDQKIRPALQPQVELDEGYEHGKDAEVRVSLEALPDVPAPTIDKHRARSADRRGRRRGGRRAAQAARRARASAGKTRPRSTPPRSATSSSWTSKAKSTARRSRAARARTCRSSSARAA